MKSDYTSKIQNIFASIDNFNKKLETEKRTKFLKLLTTDFKENEQLETKTKREKER